MNDLLIKIRNLMTLYCGHLTYDFSSFLDGMLIYEAKWYLKEACYHEISIIADDDFNAVETSESILLKKRIRFLSYRVFDENGNEVAKEQYRNITNITLN